MRIVLQIFIVISVLGSFYFMLRSVSSMRQQAMRRLILLIFAFITLLSVFFPAVLTQIANFLEVGRGTDLLLYSLIVVFFGFAASSFRHARSMEYNMTLLAREIALKESEKPQNFKKF